MERHGMVADYANAIGQMICDTEIIKAGGEIWTYFDTSDVRDALLGMEAFYDGGSTFERAKFESARTLVQCLAGAGWLGTVSMVGPHQAELLSLVQIGFGRHRALPSETAAMFWKDAGVLALGESLQSLSPPRISEIVRQQAGAAATFFKAVQCIAGTWQTRLRKWTAQRILAFDRSTDDLKDLVVSSDFYSFRRAFDEIRPTKPVTNFADAAALTVLARKNDAFREGRSRVFPCFYASHRSFYDVIARTGRAEAFEVILPSGARTSSLRTTTYFVMKGIQAGGPSEQPFFDRDELQHLAHDLHTLADDAQRDVLRIDAKPGTLVAAMRDLGFFDRVWLPYAATNDTTTALRRLDESAAVIASSDVQTAVAEELHHVLAELHASAAAYRILFRLNDELRAGYQRLRHLRSTALDAGADPLAILGLAPFALTPPARTRVSELLRGLLNEDPVALNEVMRLYLHAQRSDDGTNMAAEIVCAILWPAGLDDLIVSLRQSFRDRALPLSVELITAAAALRSNRDVAGAQASIARLEHRYAKEAKQNRGDIAIGLARLYGALGSRAKPAARMELLRKAVEYAASATQLVEDDARRAYALNQSLYYLLESRSAEPEVLRHTALRLINFRPAIDVWQYRFDDTLAFYFLSRANATDDTSQRREFLTMAADASTRARAAAPSDPEILSRYEEIKLRLAMDGN